MKLLKTLLSKLNMDKHHRIEWFGISFSGLFVALLIVSLTIGAKAHNDSKVTLGEQAMYTQSFQTSLSGVRGSVENIYSNESNTKVFLLLKLDSVSGISTNADEYQMFLTGSSPDQSPTTLNINPSGSIYVFGSTGYMGIYLSESRGFEKQILSLVVRCNSQISHASDGASAVEETGDASFAEYDQFRIYFNGGASGTTKLDILESDSELKVTDMYEAMIARPQEEAIRAQLESDVNILKTDLDRIAEYEDRLTTMGIQIPDAPELIRGDSYTLDKDGAPVIHTASVIPKGVDFDWKNGSIRDGYLDDLVGNMSCKDYFTQLNNPESNADFSLNDLVWYTATGEAFNLSNSSVTTSKDISISNDITGLQEAWRTYYSDKTKYQVTDLRSLLALEMDVKDSDSLFTVNNSDDVLINWQSK